MTQTTQQQYSRLPKNVFSPDSIDAIKNATTISPPPEKHYPYTGKREIDYAPKQAPVQTTDQATQNQAAAPQPAAESSMVRELQNKVKVLQDAVDAQAKRIDTLLASQNQVIGEFNRLEGQIKELKARPAPQQQSAPAHSSAPAAAGPMTNTSGHVNDSEFSSKKAITQQSGNGQGLDPASFSVEKYFYFGK